MSTPPKTIIENYISNPESSHNLEQFLELLYQLRVSAQTEKDADFAQHKIKSLLNSYKIDFETRCPNMTSYLNTLQDKLSAYESVNDDAESKEAERHIGALLVTVVNFKIWMLNKLDLEDHGNQVTIPDLRRLYKHQVERFAVFHVAHRVFVPSNIPPTITTSLLPHREEKQQEMHNFFNNMGKRISECYGGNMLSPEEKTTEDDITHRVGSPS